MPVIFIPTLLKIALLKLKLMPKRRTNIQLLDFLLCGISLTFALPASVALFKQRSEMKVEDLEEKFKEIKDLEGNPIKVVYFNKGM